jgi:hypothetical protein
MQLDIQPIENEQLFITGKIPNPKDYIERTVFAAAPIDRMTNYAGSGLPFPCSDIAFEGTPNRYPVPESGIIQTTFKKPNSYYTANHEKVPPTVFVRLVDKTGKPTFIKYPLEDKLPLRTLFYRQQGHDPAFYQRRADILGVQSQFSIINNLEKTKVSGPTG